MQDNGIGLDPQYAERIFKMFQRLHTHQAYAGSGIGLALMITVSPAATSTGGPTKLFRAILRKEASARARARARTGPRNAGCASGGTWRAVEFVPSRTIASLRTLIRDAAREEHERFPDTLH